MEETPIEYRDIVEIEFAEKGFSVYYDEVDQIWYAESHDPEIDEVIYFDSEDLKNGANIFGYSISSEEFQAFQEMAQE